MAKLLYDDSKRKDIADSLSTSLDDLKLAVDDCNSMSIPRSFVRYGELDGCKDQIIKLNGQLNKMNDWFNGSQTILNNVIKDLTISAKALPDPQLIERKLAVK